MHSYPFSTLLESSARYSQALSTVHSILIILNSVYNIYLRPIPIVLACSIFRYLVTTLVL